MAQLFKIRNQQSGQYLSASSGMVTMKPYSGDTNQKFQKQQGGGDTIYLTVRVDGGDVFLYFLGLGQNVEVDSTKKTTIQLMGAGSGTDYITDASTGYVLGQDGSNVVAAQKDASNFKKWVFEYAN